MRGSCRPDDPQAAPSAARARRPRAGSGRRHSRQRTSPPGRGPRAADLDARSGDRRPGLPLTGEDQFLAPDRTGARDYDAALALIESGDARTALERSEARAATWRRSAVTAIPGRRGTAAGAPLAAALRKRL